jgi:hypothetical protein
MNQPCTDPTGQRFKLGRVSITPAASAALEAARTPEILVLARHIQCDWSGMTEQDRLQNELALLLGLRVLSSYALPDGKTVWVITEADRSVTTILLPDDY